MEFKRGDRVEVTSKEDGFIGSYYTTTILAKVGPTQEYLVVYETLCTEEDEAKSLREIVDAKNVRPVPPEIKCCGYSALDRVDAYDNDGWWVGRINSDVLGGGKYSVYFESFRVEIAYPVDRLRIHQEYNKGKWSITNYKRS